MPDADRAEYLYAPSARATADASVWMDIHHRQYEGKAFFINDKGEIVGRHVKGRIMVDAIGFQECRPDYPCPRVNKVKRRYPWESVPKESQIKLEDTRPDQLEDRDYLICSPTVFGFSLDSKAFRP